MQKVRNAIRSAPAESMYTVEASNRYSVFNMFLDRNRLLYPPPLKARRSGETFCDCLRASRLNGTVFAFSPFTHRKQVIAVMLQSYCSPYSHTAVCPAGVTFCRKHIINSSPSIPIDTERLESVLSHFLYRLRESAACRLIADSLSLRRPISQTALELSFFSLSPLSNRQSN